MKWLRDVLFKFKNFIRKLFFMFYVLRARLKPNKELEQCDSAPILPPDIEMFVVLKPGKSINEHEGLYETIEQASAACAKFQELEALKKKFGNNQ